MSDAAGIYPLADTVTDLFERQATCTPDHIAVECDGRRLTYRELDARANHLAHLLIELGVRQETLVGVCLGRSIEMVIGALGILKAGGAYVALDPDEPAARLAFMLEDARIGLVLTHGAQEGLRAAGQVRLIDLDSVAQKTTPCAPPGVGIRPHHLIYVLYTSGSTGRPKGVMIEHGSVVNLLVSLPALLDFQPGDRFLVLASLAFDICVVELLLPLTTGGVALLAPRRARMDPAGLARFIDLTGPTHVQTTPAVWGLLRGMEWRPPSHTRVLISTGEALSGGLREDMGRLGATVWDLYGPTEATVWATGHPLHEGLGPRSIGRPLPGSQVHLLDDRQQPLPIGIPGELCIAGVGLARGYLHAPELTAARFIEVSAGALGLDGGRPVRLYRSGDRALLHADGSLEFLGRLDHQIKLNGLRIEPGEIEAALCRHPAVDEAVVLLRELEGGPRLVAYVTLRHAVPLPVPAALRAHLATQLPAHMIPSSMTLLERMPLSTNGKLDRAALPAPTLSRSGSGAAYTPPRTPLEAELAGIWQQVLGLHEPPGVHDSFLDLGGHSLLAVQTLSRIEGRLRRRLALGEFLSHPTIAHLASTLEQAEETTWPQPSPFASSGGEAPAPLSCAQERLWFLDRLAGGTAYHLPLGLKLRGRLCLDALSRALHEIARRHATLRSRLPLIDGAPVQVIAPPGEIALSLADTRDEEEAQAWATSFVTVPFDLEQGPLWRCLLVRRDPACHWLVVVFHHTVADGHSLELFLQELRVLYPAYLQGGAPALEPLPMQYADFAVWQRGQLQGEAFQRQLHFWQETLAGCVPLDLPTDRAPSPRPDLRGARESCRIPPMLVAAIDALAARQGATRFMTLLAAWVLLLARIAGQQDIVVGIPSTGRITARTEGLIGLFLNLLPIRTRLTGAADFGALLERVRKATLAAFDHQQLPFDRLVEHIQPPRDLRRSPLFDVLVNQLPEVTATLPLGDLELEPLELDNDTAKFFLSLYIVPSADGVRLDLVYRTALFDASRVHELLAQYLHLLGQVVADPGRAPGIYCLVTDGARARLPNPAAPLEAAVPETVLARFEAQAAAAPAAIAVELGGRGWTYEELLTTSRTLARRVRAATTGAAPIVAVTGEPSFGLIAAMLGVLRAGAVLLTLDPALPSRRRNRMLDQTGAQLCLQVGGDTGVEWPEGLPRLSVDAERGRVAIPPAPDDRVLPTAPGALDPAYLFFTSGTTGASRAILGDHRGLAHFIQWQREGFGIGPGDRVAQLTGLSFDVVLRDLFLPLTSGGTLCIPDEHARTHVAAWLQEARISVVHAVPSVLRTWLDPLVAPLPLPDLRWWFLAGEPLSADLAEAIRRRLPGAAGLINLYGPTETTLAKCHGRVGTPPDPGVQPIGRPLPQTQLLILRPDLGLCGIGEPGEVAIRTPFRTLGELGRRADTFIPNPWGRDPEDRLFLTGDLGRYRPDGVIDLLGRNDDQFKLHGVRIAPLEVEAALRALPGVRDAAIAAREEGPDLQRLIAWVLPDVDAPPTIEALRRGLGEALPAPMIPSRFVFMATLPLTSNGKLDRSALPAPEQEAPSRQTPCLPPRTPVERRLAKVWQEVLRLSEPPGLQDDFFHLGGHSLLAIQVVNRIERAFGCALPLRAFFEATTLAALAERIANLQWLGRSAAPEGQAEAEL